MREIVSVRGPITKEDMGFTQCHEHIALRRGAAAEKDPQLCIDDFEKSKEEVLRWKAAGGKTFVEAQPVGSGRDASMMLKLAEAADINILASTGFHKLDMFYPEKHWLREISEDELTELYVSEFVEGMFDDGDGAELPRVRTSARAGLVKCALDQEGLSDRYMRLFTAAARAALECDRVMMIHVDNGCDPSPLQAFLLELGLAPEQLMFCHMDRACKDLDMHEAILSAGSYLEFDTIGRFKYHSDEHEVELITQLIELGYEDQLLYSLDTTGTRLKAYVADAVGLDYILTTFNPLLRTSGVSQDAIDKLSITNPARLFAGE